MNDGIGAFGSSGSTIDGTWIQMGDIAPPAPYTGKGGKTTPRDKMASGKYEVNGNGQ